MVRDCEDVINISSEHHKRLKSYGLPKDVVSDNGPWCVAEEFEIFLKLNGIAHIKSAPYHATSNREVEWAVRTFKQAVKSIEFECGALNQKLIHQN